MSESVKTTLGERDKFLIHYSFDRYEPDIVEKDQATGKYYSYRMVSHSS
jgi:hypothetical protein